MLHAVLKRTETDAIVEIHAEKHVDEEVEKEKNTNVVELRCVVSIMSSTQGSVCGT